MIDKMKQQNTKLKKEFSELKSKLEEFIEKAKNTNKTQMESRTEISEEDMSSTLCDLM
jgi:hypothetical protein